MPIPNPGSTLVNENSQYLIGALRLQQVTPWMSIDDTIIRNNARTRSLHEYTQFMGTARRDCSRNSLGIFSSENVNTRLNGNIGYDVETKHDNVATAATYCSWRSDEACPYPDRSIYLWSSYRTNIGGPTTTSRSICMYSTP